MPPQLIARYSPGGDIYATVQNQYGLDAARQIAAAAATGDSANITESIARVRQGAARTGTSTLANLVHQLATDPLAAPLAAADQLAANTFFAFLKSPWVLGAAGLFAFISLGGWSWLQKKLK
jgi:hypothetical protein